ncbi:hypothetical protein [Rhodopirellula sp. P2]|nr:hypothetical protein [Rhodopirellula sp. P2]WDQ18954.1 hypothetical protein PSR62_10540 [Rhodopirellula sp. P2]
MSRSIGRESFDWIVNGLNRGSREAPPVSGRLRDHDRPQVVCIKKEIA